MCDALAAAYEQGARQAGPDPGARGPAPIVVAGAGRALKPGSRVDFDVIAIGAGSNGGQEGDADGAQEGVRATAAVRDHAVIGR